MAATLVRRGRSACAVVFIVSLAAVLGSRTSPATAAPGDEVPRRARCAVRLSIALLGTSPSKELLAEPRPQSRVHALIADPSHEERLARFLNATFNAGPGRTEADDAVYFLARHVLAKKLKYEELFLGKWRVDARPDGHAGVVADPQGLGYFRSPAWLRRYAGNEGEGYKITTAYRMLNNTVGLELTAMTNVPGADVSALGRRASPCKGCHDSGWFALDRVAKVLTRRRGVGDAMTFEPPSDGPQGIADAVAHDDASLIGTLVDSTAFRFNVCRLAFRFLVGRKENACETQAFDACMSAFASTGMIQDAVRTVAEDATFCM